MPWDPERYEQFKAERYAPFEDLIKLVRVRDGLRVVDLGCGTGELTRRLSDALPGSDVLGIDASTEMLARARELTRPGLRFEQRPIEEVDGEWDLIFSNAAIHWVDGHDALIRRLLSMLTAGGQLVVQLPANHGHPTQVIMRELGEEEPFRSALGGWAQEWPTLTVDAYAELLYAAGGKDLTTFEKVYPHIMEDAEALADWMAGTAMVPYMERLQEDVRDDYTARYRERLREHFPTKPVFFGFRRILFAATR